MAPKLHAACYTVFACLFEKDIEFEYVAVDVAGGEHKKYPYLNLNPFGQIPAFEDGNLVLFESRAINKYLCRKYKHQGTDLLREGNHDEAAIVNVWIDVEANQNFHPLHNLVNEALYKPMSGQTPDPEFIAVEAKKLGIVLDVYEQKLSLTKYLAGDFISLADINHLSFTNQLMMTDQAYLINSRPHVKAWWEDISTRPNWTKSLAFGKSIGLPF